MESETGLTQMMMEMGMQMRTMRFRSTYLSTSIPMATGLETRPTSMTTAILCLIRRTCIRWTVDEREHQAMSPRQMTMQHLLREPG